MKGDIKLQNWRAYSPDNSEEITRQLGRTLNAAILY